MELNNWQSWTNKDIQEIAQQAIKDEYVDVNTYQKMWGNGVGYTDYWGGWHSLSKPSRWGVDDPTGDA